MSIQLPSNGRLQVQDQPGTLREIGPENPGLRQQYDRAHPNPLRARLIGVVGIAVGVGAWWLNWHGVATEGVISVKLTVLGPLGLLGGLLSIWKPEWTGPIRPDSTKAHKTALLGLCALLMVLSGIDYYFLVNYHR
jgi:hypothetical protein